MPSMPRTCAQALKPFIDRLNAASGVVVCAEALALANQITEENAIRASQFESNAYRELSYRANVIAYLKGMVLYILNDYQWSEEIADYVRWSEQMDLWCKMRFFGQQLELLMSEEGLEKTANDLIFVGHPNGFSDEGLMSSLARLKTMSSENSPHIVEEIADVEIMILQLRRIFTISEKEINAHKRAKLKRLEKRLR